MGSTEKVELGEEQGKETGPEHHPVGKAWVGVRGQRSKVTLSGCPTLPWSTLGEKSWIQGVRGCPWVTLVVTVAELGVPGVTVVSGEQPRVRGHRTVSELLPVVGSEVAGSLVSWGLLLSPGSEVAAGVAGLEVPELWMSAGILGSRGRCGVKGHR